MISRKLTKTQQNDWGPGKWPDISNLSPQTQILYLYHKITLASSALPHFFEYEDNVDIVLGMAKCCEERIDDSTFEFPCEVLAKVFCYLQETRTNPAPDYFWSKKHLKHVDNDS